jgi:filamentous hemagglutinin
VAVKVVPRATARGDETVDLFRAVGVREFDSVTMSGKFMPAANSLEGRQFTFTSGEALAYANADISKVAILKATIDRSALSAFDFSRTIDPFIFRNGVVTVQPGAQSGLFHSALRKIDHVL